MSGSNETPLEHEDAFQGREKRKAYVELGESVRGAWRRGDNKPLHPHVEGRFDLFSRWRILVVVLV